MDRFSGSMGSHEGIAEKMQVNPVQIETYLKGVKYPVSSRDLITFAQQSGAPEQVIVLLRKLPVREFTTPAEVTKALGDIS